MKVALHGIVADCPSCHGNDFEPLGGKRVLLASQTAMQCTRCGAHTPYLQLLIQIGDKAIARSLETLERIRAQRLKIRSRPQDKPE